ncbi:DUF4143 domain-containing protein [Mesorhizobium australicum]|uniref:DUF4143 domain-containing protein n=1 Tax=Mesorhizobium australicum TaxID=536018 RepID=UPI00333B2269
MGRHGCGAAFQAAFWPLATAPVDDDGRISAPIWSATSPSAVPAFRPRRCAASGPCWPTPGRLLNAAEFARALGVDGKTVASYLDLLVDLLLVRRLEPWHANVGKRLVKSPRAYVRDSGITHTLLGLATQEDVLGHPVAGASWKGS